MDFHTLSRKQLQALCKKNKIPANMTNVAMANSLAALEQVEGIEEVLNPLDSDAQKISDEKDTGTPACRTSTRRKPVVEEPESSKISTRLRRGTRAKNDEETDQENKDLNVPVTPAVPTTRRRAPAASTRRKKEDERPNDQVPKTPAASNSRVKSTSAYNTRKSVRLLEKNLSKMSLVEKEETGSVKVDDETSEELTSFSKQIEDSVDSENGASSLEISTEVTEKTDESELTSSEKNLSKTSFMDADETESVKVDEISEEMTGRLQKIEESEDAKIIFMDGDETESVKVDEISEEMTGLPQKIEESEDTVKEMPLVSGEASDKGASLEAEPEESLVKINESGSPLKDMNNSSESDVELSKSIAKEVDAANNESGTENICQIENSCDSLEPENNIFPCTENDAFSDDKQESNEHSNMGNDIQNSVLMLSSHAEDEVVIKMEDDSAEIHVSKVDDEVDASMIVDKNEASEIIMWAMILSILEESFVLRTTKRLKLPVTFEEMISAENKAIETTAYDNQKSEEMFSAEIKAVETASDIQNSGEMFYAENKVVQVEEHTSPLVHGELEFRTSSDIEESKEYVEKDAVMEASNEPSSEGNMNVQRAADSQSSEGNMNAQGEADSQSSLVIIEAEAGSETTDVQIGNEECKEDSDEMHSTLTSAPISSELKTSDFPIQFTCEDQSALKDNAAVEVKSVRKMYDEEGDKQKENQINDDLASKSMRQLKKMLKNLSLDNKTNNEKSSVKEVERKRTALQELPENRMTESKGQQLLP
ncbi:LOW QUALITY PROTEIN: uncharacterized protein LOC129297304 [Prosopis cineraria]|uniref:LOW QUALITY PROTEIN: uncharacterized protein LOC129297304 n=1 Tax=Prosopis cineraria TaxID=364024 RepID=UPI00240FAA88|nr:LOW QUALITY PROTEIN: uncharacterized protein LOC129297304 [Prosopis cineraria]